MCHLEFEGANLSFKPLFGGSQFHIDGSKLVKHLVTLLDLGIKEFDFLMQVLNLSLQLQNFGLFDIGIV